MTEQCYRSAVLNKVKSSRCTTLMSEEPRITETFIYWLHTWTTNPTTLTALLSFKNLNSVYVQHQKKEEKKKKKELLWVHYSFPLQQIPPLGNFSVCKSTRGLFRAAALTHYKEKYSWSLYSSETETEIHHLWFVWKHVKMLLMRKPTVGALGDKPA